MKSAYELAMERLRAEDPDSKPLTDEQKAELTDIDKRYQAKVAEREVFLNGELDKARANGDAEGAAQLERQIRDEKALIEEEREAAKDKVRKS